MLHPSTIISGASVGERASTIEWKKENLDLPKWRFSYPFLPVEPHILRRNFHSGLFLEVALKTVWIKFVSLEHCNRNSMNMTTCTYLNSIILELNFVFIIFKEKFCKFLYCLSLHFVHLYLNESQTLEVYIFQAAAVKPCVLRHFFKRNKMWLKTSRASNEKSFFLAILENSS